MRILKFNPTSRIFSDPGSTFSTPRPAVTRLRYKLTAGGGFESRARAGTLFFFFRPRLNFLHRIMLTMSSKFFFFNLNLFFSNLIKLLYLNLVTDFGMA